MRKRSSKGGGAQRSIQVHLMVDEEEAAMIRAAARKRNQTVSLTIIEAVKLVTFSPACRGGGFLLKNPSGFSIDRLSPHALWFARFMSRATR